MARRARHRSQRGFTLIELMIVVAIIGILASIAIPNFRRFQLKSKTSEVKINLASIRTAEESYFTEFGRYLAAVNSPASVPNGSPVLFTPTAGFDAIGFEAEGRVYFSYAVVTTPSNLGYTADAAGDIDGNLNHQRWGYVHPDPSGATEQGTWLCGPAGVYNPVTGTLDLVDTVGPCFPNHGTSIF